jgi:hypothetical protein
VAKNIANYRFFGWLVLALALGVKTILGRKILGAGKVGGAGARAPGNINITFSKNI